MDTSYVEELRLSAYKSFRDAALPLDELTLVVGRNGSGKSNALEGLWTLARLAHGDDLRDALDGSRDASAVRGGAAGCAPFGSNAFRLGCTVRTGGTGVALDLRVQTEPRLQITEERLAVDGHRVLWTDDPDPDSSDITVRWDNQKQGPAPKITFRASQLLISQVLSRVPATEAGQRIHLAAAQVRSALRQVFVLDPVPHLMRQYVPSADTLLRRDAENLSAAVASLIDLPASKDHLRMAMAALNEQDVADIQMVKSELGDVMLTLVERTGGGLHPVSARVMSDGSLRFLAILVALMQSPTIDTAPELLAAEDAAGQTTVVIEELENGLHASQAVHLLALVREQVAARRVRMLATGHSPALLDGLTGDEHGSVVVCQRGPEGLSTLTRLVDLPNYLSVATMGGLGNAAKADKLRVGSRPSSSAAVAALEAILGSA
ncbi:MAG: AAA family ATPase [Acidimicrobiia bacterium]